MGTEPPPLGAVRTELLATGEPVPTIDPLCHAGRQEDGDVVAGLGMTRGDDLAGHGGLVDPAEGGVAGLLELEGDPHPVGVHGQGQGGGGGVAGESALAGRRLGQVEAPPAQLGGHDGGRVADGPQVSQVLVEVRVGPVQLGSPSAERLQPLDVYLGGAGTGVGGVWGDGDAHAPTLKVAGPTTVSSAPTPRQPP